MIITPKIMEFGIMGRKTIHYTEIKSRYTECSLGRNILFRYYGKKSIHYTEINSHYTECTLVRLKLPYSPMYKPWAYTRTQGFLVGLYTGGAYTQGGLYTSTKKWYLSEKHVSTQWVISIQNHRFSAFFASFS